MLALILLILALDTRIDTRTVTRTDTRKGWATYTRIKLTRTHQDIGHFVNLARLSPHQHIIHYIDREQTILYKMR